MVRFRIRVRFRVRFRVRVRVSVRVWIVWYMEDAQTAARFDGRTRGRTARTLPAR